jgi:hypothetical protein
LTSFDESSWKTTFIDSCTALHSTLETSWSEDWLKLCSGKLLIDDIYREYTIKIGKLEFKKKLIKRMKSEQSEDWTLVRSKIRDALGI